jgi:biotin-(acetyl-CoA carboxylase) ligase
MEDRLDSIVEQLEELVRENQQTRIAEALEDIASLLYSINQKIKV